MMNDELKTGEHVSGPVFHSSLIIPHSALTHGGPHGRGVAVTFEKARTA
jgi:hypothetical protein